MCKIKKITGIFLSCLFISLIMSGCANEVTGNEFLKNSRSSYDDIKAYFEGMDEVITLYTLGSISSDDFKNELNLLRQQYTILTTLKEKNEKENPIKPESHSYISKEGMKALNDLYNIIEQILNSTVDENGTPFDANKIAYTYLSFKQSVADCCIRYETAYKTLLRAESYTDI